MTRLALVLSTLGLLLGCSTEPEPVGARTAALTNGVCDPARRIGVPSRARYCPAPSPRSGWTVAPLFQQSATITDGGRPFCLYEYVGAPGSFSTAWLPNDPGTSTPGDQWTDADCLGLIALADPDPKELVNPAHVEASRLQMGRPSELPAIPSDPGLPIDVHVAILDSSEDSASNELEPTSGEFLHGRAVALANREHTCPEGRGPTRCIPDFDTYLVLDHGGDPGAPGGHYGPISGLAVALEKAVLGSPSGEPLVIPLAVGWESRFNHRDANTALPTSNSVKAVRAAIDYAVCQGALVMAAAGNRYGAAEATGPLCPACWEQASPSCATGGPLVYAVGAVGPDGEPLAVSRIDGQPPIVAAGEAASADSLGGETLGTWTGTSMGVAHAGAAATILWGYQPSLSAQQVMAQMLDAGEPVAEAADFCHSVGPSGDCPPVHRVTACGALRRAVTSACTTGDCPEPECEARPDAEPYYSADLVDKLFDLADGSLPTQQSLAQPIAGTQCSEGVYGDGVFDPSQSYCAWESGSSYASAPPTLDPQPGPDGCGACAVFVKPDGDYVYIAVDPKLVGYLSDPVLEVAPLGYIALKDGLQPGTLLYAGDVVAVPLKGLQGQIDWNKPVILSFLWQDPANNTGPVMVSGEIKVY